MPHINLPEGLPGITAGFAFRPETASPMSQLAEVLLRGPSTLTSGEREMIATFVSTRNDCYFCQTSHRAAAAHHLQGSYELVDAVRWDYQNAPVTPKLKALLTIAGKVQQGGKNVSVSLTIFGAWIARFNVFEMMFHPYTSPAFGGSGFIKLDKNASGTSRVALFSGPLSGHCLQPLDAKTDYWFDWLN